jgi:ABC-2 type transport system permease protein
MIRTYLLLAWTWLKASAQYPGSLIMMVIGSFIVSALDVAAIWVIFEHVGSLGGFDLAEVMFLYGAAGLSFALSDILFGNVERLSQHIKAGTFDTMLIRPAGAFVQMATDRFSVQRLGRLAQAAVVLAVALPQLGLAAGRAWMIPVMILCGTVIFASIFTLGGAMQFLLTDAPEVANAFTYGGNTVTSYPLTVFPSEVLKAMTFVIPLAFVNWYPSLHVLGREDPLGYPDWTQWLSPLVAAAMVAVTMFVWRTGVRQYRSTGS